jgi:hypothetical protein
VVLAALIRAALRAAGTGDRARKAVRRAHRPGRGAVAAMASGRVSLATDDLVEPKLPDPSPADRATSLEQNSRAAMR